MVLVVSSSILDFKSYRLAKSRVGTFQDPVPKMDKIPFYASIISATMLVPYFVYLMVLGNFVSNFSPVSKYYSIMVLTTVVNMLRNPLTGLHYLLLNMEQRRIIFHVWKVWLRPLIDCFNLPEILNFWPYFWLWNKNFLYSS